MYICVPSVCVWQHGSYKRALDILQSEWQMQDMRIKPGSYNRTVSVLNCSPLSLIPPKIIFKVTNIIIKCFKRLASMCDLLKCHSTVNINLNWIVGGMDMKLITVNSLSLAALPMTRQFGSWCRRIMYSTAARATERVPGKPMIYVETYLKIFFEIPK